MNDKRNAYFVDAISRLDEALNKWRKAERSLDLAFRGAKALAITSEQEREIEQRRKRRMNKHD